MGGLSLVDSVPRLTQIGSEMVLIKTVTERVTLVFEDLPQIVSERWRKSPLTRRLPPFFGVAQSLRAGRCTEYRRDRRDGPDRSPAVSRGRAWTCGRRERKCKKYSSQGLRAARLCRRQRRSEIQRSGMRTALMHTSTAVTRPAAALMRFCANEPLK